MKFYLSKYWNQKLQLMNNFEMFPCPLCGANESKILFKRKDLTHQISEIQFPVARCCHCNFVYVNPRPGTDDIHHYYPEDFYNATSTPEETILEKSRSLLAKYDKVKKFAPGRLLDIGCAKGEFMFMMEKKGWKVSGLDFSPKPPNLFNLDITYGDLSSASFKKESFDLVTLWAVLEHVYEPKKMLEEINQLVKPGGALIILVTNFNSIAARFLRSDDVPRHVNLFTKKTITEMLTSAGFETETFYFDQDIFGGSVRGLLNQFVKLIAGEALDDILAQRWIPGRWNEFTSQLFGKDSWLIKKIDSFDMIIYPLLDRIFDALQFGFIMTVVSIKKENHINFDITKAVPINQPFVRESKYAWKISIPDDNILLGDNSDNPLRSRLILLENNKPLWKSHSLHTEIRGIGMGRYSHWNNELLFSTSDNSNPNTNGRNYQIAFTEDID